MITGAEAVEDFNIHPQLEKDTHYLGELPSGCLLLHRNATLPWFILVPHTDARELHKVPEPLRSQISEDTDAMAGFVSEAMGADKINIGAIGNIVPQLHIHIIGRHEDDPCWPGVVWGRLEPGPEYSDDDIAEIVMALEG